MRKPQQEAVELRLGQRMRAVVLDGILRRHHQERLRQAMHDAVDADRALGHRLEQRRLGLRRLARLISSASTTCAKRGPGWKTKAPVARPSCISGTEAPTRSAGSRSLVNWMRRKLASTERASACASVVLPTPGTSSTSTCPPATHASTQWRTTSDLPRNARSTLARRRPANSAARTGSSGLRTCERSSAPPALFGAVCASLKRQETCSGPATRARSARAQETRRAVGLSAQSAPRRKARRAGRPRGPPPSRRPRRRGDRAELVEPPGPDGEVALVGSGEREAGVLQRDRVGELRRRDAW